MPLHEAFLSLLWVILCVVGILLLSYLFTRYVAGRSAGLTGRGCGNGPFRVLARLSLGREQSAVLIQAGERYLLLGVTQAEITTLAELSQTEAQILCPPSDPEQPADFMQTLRSVFQQKKQR